MSPSKVLIINPPSFDNFQYIKEGRCESRKGGQLTPPVTLGIISSLLTKNGYKNDLYDFMADLVSYKDLISILSKKYDVVFINVSAQTFKFDKKTAEIIRDNNKSCLICALGVLATALPKKVLTENFDVCIHSEPEYTALELVRNFKKNNKSYLNKINGISYKKKNKIITTKKRSYIENLDELPFPDRDKLPISEYINPRTGKPFTVIKVQRGCPYSCSFCTAPFYYGKKPRHRSVKNIIDEIKLCVLKYNITDFLFLSDTFTINHGFVKDLCNNIFDKNLEISWSCNSRVDTFNEDIAKIMKKAGCWLISFGVESANSRIIKENFKKINPQKAVKVADICKKSGIKSIMYYILGFPGETRKEMIQTINLALKVNSDFARFFVATPLPGSKLYNNAFQDHDIKLNNLNLSDSRSNLSSIEDKELKYLIRNAYLRFYLRPGQIYRLVSIFEVKNFFNLIKSGLNFAKDIYNK